MRRTVTRTAALVLCALIFFALAPARAQERDSHFVIASVYCDKKGTVYTPTVIVRNVGTKSDTCEVWVSVGEDKFSSLTGDLYSKTINVKVPGGDVRTVTFPSFNNGVEYTTLYYYVSVELPGVDSYDDDDLGTWSW